jgi:uncharacterized membrane protein
MHAERSQATSSARSRLWMPLLRSLIWSTVAVVPLHSALADFKLCNYTESRVGVSIGYRDAQGWVTEGWWNVLSRGCVTLIEGNLSGRFYYLHAIDYDRGGEWSGQKRMCVDDKSFTIRDVKDCGKRGHRELGFYEVDTGDSKDYTVRLIDPPSEGATNP